MRPLVDWDESDLIAFIRDEVQESLTLDYKRSLSLGRSSAQRSELSKDVSAFANSEGGMLIYGIEEDGHVPVALDAGVDRTQITKEWLESVLKTNVHPIIERMVIKQVELLSKGANSVAYVLEIGQATSRAPHQASDRRYYKRFNFESTPMEDYEVRDLMRRSIEFGRKYGVAWDLDIEIQRLMSALNERGQLDIRSYLSRDRLIITVSPALRSAGSAIVMLEKPLRNKVAELISKVDRFNAEIETADSNMGRSARLNERLKHDLASARTIAGEVSGALREILDREP
jgi:predicted HTH transcriptional regulator